ncbi:MAG: hypothetical protein A3G34_08955 [Candidatus Lindowbacteria bacterium RIFCSPLOWO2_12_FULL_62_27]|nr:MAG: hypothetical protein A3I06_08815 [Candidatus Lindowbacteria bacterium RIFCSPLOWO2_02_FULL_62_12]OGH60825.1 MAG: hypothetical protein A3G34_08955 [Candidatus Lindowbacteria bacterium RIFCSPLOWO2_12_FULL_62_27]
MLDSFLCLIFGNRRFRWIMVIPAFLAAVLLLSSATESWDAPVADPAVAAVDPATLRKLKAENDKWTASLDTIRPKGVYVVIDTARNRLFLKHGRKTLLEAVCSTGNGKILNDSFKNRTWTFDTPRGERKIQRKVHEPVWTKPDWAFIEEGERIPTSVSERVEEGMLGNYAMHIGDGYMIHGTLYRRLLGRPVTHGCIRLGDADLEKVFKACAVGTPVYIF